MSRPKKDSSRRRRALVVGCLLIALAGAGYWFFIREQPLRIGPPEIRERVEVETDLRAAPLIADIYVPNSGFGTYWSARDTHDREGVRLGEEVVLDWDTVEPRTIDLWIDRLFHQAGLKLLPGFYRDTVPRIMNTNFARRNTGWQIRYAATAAESLQTDLALEMAAGWARLATPDEFVQAYTQVGVVLGNAGRGEALAELAAFKKGRADPLRMRPKLIPELFPVEWAAAEDTPAGLWQRHQWYLLINDRQKAGEALEALEMLADREAEPNRFLRWFQEQRSMARARYERLGRHSREILRESHAEALPAMVEVLRFYQHIAELKDYGAVVDRYDDEALFQLIGYFGEILDPDSIEYSDLLLYAIEMRRLDRWDWPMLHLTSSAPTIAEHYRDIRAHAIYRILLVQAAHAPELLNEEPGTENFKLLQVAILNKATKKLIPISQFLFDRDALHSIHREYHPYFEEFRDEADVFTGSVRKGGARRDFYRNYFWLEARIGLLDQNLDKWWTLAKKDPQTSVRGRTRGRLQHYFLNWGDEPKIDLMLRLAELMLFNSESAEELEITLRQLSLSPNHMGRDQEAISQYVAGFTKLLDRFERERPAAEISLAECREKLKSYIEE